jgi:hypothetical protein
MARKSTYSEIKSDLDTVSTRIAGVERNGSTPDSSRIAEEILVERRDRLRKQNVKLDHEIARAELTYGDLQEHRNQVLRANLVVKSGLFAMAIRISEQLALMDDPAAIQTFLHDQLSAVCNDLAYEGHRNTAD